MGKAIAPGWVRGGSSFSPTLSEAQLKMATELLDRDGYAVHAVRTDVRRRRDVVRARLGGRASSVSSGVSCTPAGVSPVQATPEQIVAVDVVGTAHVLDAFEPLVRAGHGWRCASRAWPAP